MRVVVVGEKLYSHLFEIVKITQGLGYSSLFFKSLSKANIASNDIIVIDCSITPELSTDISNFVISVAT
ncbi:MAG: hypothetical protein IJ730_08095, partial [Alphaproteobacteria bacterium]|nr:hypothetical protein [Alphaproteobacteria bacterium]